MTIAVRSLPTELPSSKTSLNTTTIIQVPEGIESGWNERDCVELAVRAAFSSRSGPYFFTNAEY